MSMRTSAHTTTTNNRFWLLILLNPYFFGGRQINPKIETKEDIERELIRMGYSKKVIQEIFKWIPSTKK
jgi:hypothetical protein